MINVLIGGDTCPIGKNEYYFRIGDAAKLFNDLLVEFEKADLSIVDLECPMISKSSPITKAGPILGVHNDCINGFINAKIDVLNLANNHILDHGPSGLTNTLEMCDKAGISTVGAGKNIEAARKILVKKLGNIRIGILSMAEHEFSIATDNSWGANPLDLIDFVRNIRNQKDKFEYLIVLLHGGNEHYPFPSPRIRDTCQFMVEMGANVVIVQHTHCPGSLEEYQNGHIVYGQGNMIFDWPSQNKAFNEGFLVKISITDDLNSTMDVIPYMQSKGRIGARKMDEEVTKIFLQSLKERSRAITEDDFIKTKWLEFCDKRKNEYLSKVLRHNRLLSKLYSNGRFSKYMYTKNTLTSLRNVISCEAHREVLETIFNNQIM